MLNKLFDSTAGLDDVALHHVIAALCKLSSEAMTVSNFWISEFLFGSELEVFINTVKRILGVTKWFSWTFFFPCCETTTDRNGKSSTFRSILETCNGSSYWGNISLMFICVLKFSYYLSKQVKNRFIKYLYD